MCKAPTTPSNAVHQDWHVNFNNCALICKWKFVLPLFSWPTSSLPIGMLPRKLYYNQKSFQWSEPLKRWCILILSLLSLGAAPTLSLWFFSLWNFRASQVPHHLTNTVFTLSVTCIQAGCSWTLSAKPIIFYLLENMLLFCDLLSFTSPWAA